MKRLPKLLALLMSACVFLSSLTSCVSYLRLSSLLQNNETQEEVEIPSVLEYCLTEADYQLFSTLLECFLTLALDGTDLDAIGTAEERMEAQYYHISTQSKIAYILYCCDTSDKGLSDQYLLATEMSTNAYGEYAEACRTLYQSDSVFRDEYFADWTKAEISEMLHYSDEVTAISQENEQLLVEYRALSEEEFDGSAPGFFLDIVKNNTRTAELMGFDNYYDYAAERIYGRDFDRADIALMRTYVKEYIAPYLDDVYTAFENQYQSLNSFRQAKIYRFLYRAYDNAGEYVQSYLEALPEKMRQSMAAVLTPAGAIYATSSNAYEGAFTSYLPSLNMAYCYFGPNYQDTRTIVHEMGHYYASCFEDGFYAPIDVAEIHSQANEWLMLSTLAESMEQKVYETLRLYLIYEAYSTVVSCMIIDEFENRVYCDPLNQYDTAVELDALMEEICQDYGGIDFINQNVADIQWYWRVVTVESPVYYISYATSGIVALEFYLDATDNFNEAVEKYKLLIEGSGSAVGFAEAILEVGLSGAFSEETYKRLKNTFL